MNWFLGERSPVGARRGSSACRQISHLLAICWGLQLSSGVSPELETGPSYLADGKKGMGELRNVNWGTGSEGWGSLAVRPVTHLFFKLVGNLPMPMEFAGVSEEDWP